MAVPGMAPGWDTVVWALARASSSGPGYVTLEQLGGGQWSCWPAKRPATWDGADWGYNLLPVGAPRDRVIPVVRLAAGLPRRGGNSDEAMTAAVCLARMYANNDLDPRLDAAAEMAAAIAGLADTMEFERRHGGRRDG